MFKAKQSFDIEPKPTTVINDVKVFNSKRNLYVYDLKKFNDFDLIIKYDNKNVQKLSDTNPNSLLKVHRYVTGMKIKCLFL